MRSDIQKAFLGIKLHKVTKNNRYQNEDKSGKPRLRTNALLIN